MGYRLEVGHYITVARKDATSWLKFNDGQVRIISTEEALSLQTPYLLFYERRGRGKGSAVGSSSGRSVSNCIKNGNSNSTPRQNYFRRSRAERAAAKALNDALAEP